MSSGILRGFFFKRLLLSKMYRGSKETHVNYAGPQDSVNKLERRNPDSYRDLIFNLWFLTALPTSRQIYTS
jgi:hypothetical protein